MLWVLLKKAKYYALPFLHPFSTSSTCNIYFIFMMKKLRARERKNKRIINVVELSVKHLIQSCKAPQSWSVRFLSFQFWYPLEVRLITASNSMALPWVLYICTRARWPNSFPVVTQNKMKTARYLSVEGLCLNPPQLLAAPTKNCYLIQ